MTMDRSFLERFETASIPKAEWDHRAHIRLAYEMLARVPFDVSIQRLREGIPRLNRSHGVLDTETSGYHETLTVVWAALVHERDPAGSPDFETFVERHPELLSRELVLEHYAPGTLFSVRARRAFVPPDRRAIPSLERAA